MHIDYVNYVMLGVLAMCVWYTSILKTIITTAAADNASTVSY